MTAAPHFSTDLDHVARHLRAALSSMLLAAGLDPTDPQSLARQWGVNRQLSWKVAKIIQIRDAYIALQHLPGSEGLAIILKKAEQAGVEAPILDKVRHAADAFEHLIDKHCGDRAVFDIMGSELSQVEQARQHQENLRKQFFLGASSIWGAQTKVNLVSWFICPSAEPGKEASHLDLVNLKAWVGFRRLRENLPWAMSRQMSRHDSGAVMSVPTTEALDPRSSSTVPALHDFCSKPVPEFNVREEGGRTTVSLAPGPVGNAGLLTCAFGKIQRGLPRFRSENDQFSRLMCYLHVPSEVTIFDLFVHESLTEAMSPAISLSSLMEPHEPHQPDAERNRLPLHEPLIRLGVPSPAPLTLEVPRYAEMIDLAVTRMKRTPQEFVGFRLRMNYPPLPAALVMKYELPEPR
ncbi:MAG TPA: hypothetical protein VGM81_10910 [Burkholderiaceae bacterium]